MKVKFQRFLGGIEIEYKILVIFMLFIYSYDNWAKISIGGQKIEYTIGFAIVETLYNSDYLMIG